MFNKLTNINQKSVLLFLYVVILGVFAPAIYVISHNDTQLPLGGGRVVDNPNPIQKRVSIGDKILIAAKNNLEKQKGVAAFADGDYVDAQDKLSTSLKSDRNDPEARIYLNNTLAAKTKDQYKIAVSVPIGGDLDVAQEILRGVAQAQDEINHSGGINGKLVMVKITNDDNDPEIAQEIAQQLIEDKKVLAVVGHNGSNASFAAAPIYQDAGLVMITPTSSAESISTIGDYIFRATPGTRDLAESLAKYAVETAGKKKITMCIDSDAQASVSFKENFTWAVYNHGGKIIPLNCDLAAADFVPREIISKAISQGSDALLLAPSIRKVDKAMEIVAANNDRLTLFGNHSLNTYKTLQDGQNDVNGMVFAVAWHPSQAIKANSFVRNANELWGGAVNWRTAMAYDAAQTIFKAIASGSSERQEVQQALANPEFSARGASSRITFLPSGDRNLRGTLVKIQPGKKSGTGFDFDFVSSNKTNKKSTSTIAK